MARELTIGELSARSGVSQSALRFYEREGLISARRTDGNQRRYATVTLRRWSGGLPQKYFSRRIRKVFETAG